LVAFSSITQPVLDTDCASPNCHGRPERPLAIFSPGKYRRDPARTFLNEPLDESELAANAQGVAAFALDPLTDGQPIDMCLVLRKPLARAAGGSGHEGGEQYRDTAEPGYQGLRTFLATLLIPEGL